MINVLAVFLAAFMIPNAPADTIMPDNNLSYAEPLVYVRPTTIKTPNGSDVDIEYEEEKNLDYDRMNDEFQDYFYYNAENVSANDKIELVDKGSNTYNNFAYAFYMYWGGDIKCKIYNINPYMEDMSFVRVYEPQKNDIVCYRMGNSIIHAGIVKSVMDKSVNSYIGSNLIVESKWFEYGVFEHRGDLCPYTYMYSMLIDKDGNFIEGADEVVYYRRHAEHSFKVVNGSDNGDMHTVKCEECEKTETVNHDYKYIRNKLTHKKYCDCGWSENEVSHSWVSSDAGINYVKCKYCSFVKKLGDDEILPSKPYKLNFLIEYALLKEEL